MALTSITSQLIADVGISFGDEGKGRLIPELISELQGEHDREDIVSCVFKVNGGANSGHTAGGLKLNLLPAGVIARGVSTLGLGCGVVADPRKLLWEMKTLEKHGFRLEERLLIDERCMVSDLTHRLLDLAWEFYREEVLGQEKRGSTGRGITPAYLDEVGQWQLFYGDTRAGKDFLREKLLQRADRALRTIRHVCQVTPEAWERFFQVLTDAETRANEPAIEEGIFPVDELDFYQFAGNEPFTLNEARFVEVYTESLESLLENIGDLRERLLAAIDAGDYVIGEFGQSYWLDKRFGFSPNLTASHTFTPEIFQSGGLPMRPVHVVGCCKAYDTKVGTHLFLAEMDEDDPLTAKLKRLEFGTSTGRQRKVGWFDAVEKGDCLRYGGAQDLVINKLDALTNDVGFPGGLKICTHYRDPENGEIYSHVPRTESTRKRLEPVYRECPSWTEDISGVRQFVDLPEAAKRYVACCMKATWDVAKRHQARCVPPNLRYIGVGPDPSQIIKDVPAASALFALAED